MVEKQREHTAPAGATDGRAAIEMARQRMSRRDDLEDALLGIAPYYALLLLLVLAAAGVFFVSVAQPVWLAPLAASLGGSQPKVYWYLSRSSAMVAFGLLWLSMALGLAITNKVARVWPSGPTLFDLHEYASLLGLGFGAFHALILTGDRYTNYTLGQVLIPFGSANYRPLWVGLGQVGVYLLAIVTFSFYVRRLIGHRAWRLIHFASFGCFVLVLIHGIFSGTDSAATWVRDLYWFSFVSLAGLTVYRVAARSRRGVQPQAPSTR